MTDMDDVLTSAKPVVISRVFDAPRELVWQAWTEPDRAMQWWGPTGFTTPVAEIDLRVGGRYHNCMRSPDGQDYWSTGVFKEIVEFERLVMTDSFSDAEGNVAPASDYGMDEDWPLELLITVTFEEIDGQTKLILRHQGIPTGQDQEMCQEGWSQSFDKLADYLAEELEE